MCQHFSRQLLNGQQQQQPFLSFLSITTEEQEVLSFLAATAAISVLVSLVSSVSWDPPGRGLFLDNDMTRQWYGSVLVSFVYSSTFLWKLFSPSFNRMIEGEEILNLQTLVGSNSLIESRVSSVIRCQTVFCSRSLKFKACKRCDSG